MFVTCGSWHCSFTQIHFQNTMSNTAEKSYIKKVVVEQSCALVCDLEQCIKACTSRGRCKWRHQAMAFQEAFCSSVSLEDPRAFTLQDKCSLSVLRWKKAYPCMWRASDRNQGLRHGCICYPAKEKWELCVKVVSYVWTMCKGSETISVRALFCVWKRTI